MIPQTVDDDQDPHDAWALTSSGYDVEKFYVRASDSRGHSSLVHVKMSPNLHAQLGLLVNDQNLPYRSMADVLRDALVHRVRWIADQRADGVELWAPSQDELFAAELEDQREQRARRRQLIQDVWDTINEALSDDDIDACWEIVDTFEHVVDEYAQQFDRIRGWKAMDMMREHIRSFRKETLLRRMHSVS